MSQKRFLPLLILAISALLVGCSSNPVSKQTRTDLTAEHIRGLYADMDRNDVEDLLGKSDSALAENESFEMYSLADGTSAVLRYAGDKLQAAYIRGKDNIEEAIFNNYSGMPSSTIDDGTDHNDGKNDEGIFDDNNDTMTNDTNNMNNSNTNNNSNNSAADQTSDSNDTNNTTIFDESESDTTSATTN